MCGFNLASLIASAAATASGGSPKELGSMVSTGSFDRQPDATAMVMTQRIEADIYMSQELEVSNRKETGGQTCMAGAYHDRVHH
ncbi:MAG TPA: hypothetical protein VJB15_10065 [Rhodothermia bacterium]|nr:hypothetical protein [Rhodothermia bacterium]